MENNIIAPVWATGVPDKPLEWFYPNVFVRGELNGVHGIPGDGKTWLMCEIGIYAIAGIYRTLWTLGRLKESDGEGFV